MEQTTNNNTQFFRKKKKVNGEIKWYVTDNNEIEVVPAVYDYIAPIINPNLIKVFTGDFTWHFDDETCDIYFEKIFENTWNGANEYKGTLGLGKWGIIDSSNNVIMPIMYNWIELRNDNIIEYNQYGSRIIKSSDDDSNIVWSVVGGTWAAQYITGEIITQKPIHENNDIVDYLKSLEPFKYDERYLKQRIDKY